MAKVAILDYDAGNSTSVERAVRHLQGDAVITNDRETIRSAERLIFPGVGAAGASMENLARYGLDEELVRAREAGKPILSICIGCQVIFDESEEDGGVRCLGMLPGKVVAFKFAEGISRKIPHMGWNEVRFIDTGRHPVFESIEAGSQFYFVHGFHPLPAEQGDIQGRTTYGNVEFAAAVARDHLVAVQFHPEKSGRCGLRILENFLSWCG